MSVGVWALSLFALVAALTFAATLAEARGGSGGLAALMAGPVGTVITAVGALLGLFVASYTGVLLSVSNQAVWSDTWTLGGLFLASGMSAAAVVVTVLARRRAAAGSERRLAEADGWFAVVELLFVVLLIISLGAAGTAGTVFGHGWALLWVVVALGLLGPLMGLLRRGLAGVMAMVSPAARRPRGLRAPGGDHLQPAVAGMPPRVGVELAAPGADPGAWLAEATAYEAAGVDSLWVPGGDAGAWVLLGALSAVTWRVRLGALPPAGGRAPRRPPRRSPTSAGDGSRPPTPTTDPGYVEVEAEGTRERWMRTAPERGRPAWAEALAAAEAAGAAGILVPAAPGLVDLLRNPEDEDDRSDLQLAHG